ncbi:hypothetical protein DSO57_1015727 [Entomophthora muscae]|uniref:Uncharacterized protein n=1 Tax=Entomophthora muscae TaxID=34485 RepID=A0ACC2RWC4_9FUNG|nr:hypothetical protein DSO57_1015727 [Entomophthora muscae]
MIKLIVTSTTLSAHAFADQPSNEEYSRLVVLGHDDSKVTCMGTIRDSTSFVAPASCVTSNPQDFKFIHQGYTHPGKILTAFQDTRWKKPYFAFNQALAFTSPIQGQVKELKYHNPSSEKFHVVDLNRFFDIQVHEFTLADQKVCRDGIRGQNVAVHENIGDLFCATASAEKEIVLGAPAFNLRKDRRDQVTVAGMYVGKTSPGNSSYYYFVHASNIFL